jgi:preprotein translocase subunit SecG
VALFGVSVWSYLFNSAIILVGLLLILIVLIQRGKGGGLAGAFGGMGGSSAFGTRAGDTFTRITIVVAAVWVFLLMLHIKVVHCDTAKVDTQGTFGSGSP